MKNYLLMLIFVCSHLFSFGQANPFSYNESVPPQTDDFIVNRLQKGGEIETSSIVNKMDSWSTDFSVPGIYGDVYSSATDGSKLYLGGTFKAAGNKIANNVAVWDGQEWQAIGEDIENGVGGDVPSVRAMAYAQGKLYVGGQFRNAGSHTVGGIAFWDGTKWNNLGEKEMPLKRIIIFNQDTTLTQGFVYGLLAHGNKIYVRGDFQMVGNQFCNGIAAWNIVQQQWETFGTGAENPPGWGSAIVSAFAAIGPDLYIGGSFQSVNGVQAENIAKWNGSAWTAVGHSDSWVTFLQPDSQGRLYASGYFSTIGGVPVNHGIALLENGQWNPALQSRDYTAQLRKLLFHDNEILAIGVFDRQVDGAYTTLAKWENGDWVLNFELSFASNENVPGNVNAIELIQNRIYIAGIFTKADEVLTHNVIEWEPKSSAWINLAENLPHKGIYDGDVLAISEYQGEMYIGGDFSIAGGIYARNIAKWDGAGWQSLGVEYDNGVRGTVITMASNDTNLFVGGYFGAVGSVEAYHIGKWNGTAWSSIGIGVGGVIGAHVNALAVWGNYLYVGGYFSVVGDAQVFALPANSIARFNLVTERWEELGAGVEFTLGRTGVVHGFDVTGDTIFVVGDFNTTDGQYSPNVGILVDNKWENVRTQQNVGLEGKIYSVKYIDQNLLVGGILQLERNGPSVGIARWNGSEWEAFEQGMTAENALPYVNEILPFGNGFIAGGFFQQAGNTIASNIAYYDGQQWLSLGEGIRPGVAALWAIGADIFVGGSLMFSGNITSAGIAKYHLEETTSSIYKPTRLSMHLLGQSYPNPSQQSTRINYHIPKANHVSLEVFDVKGQTVMMPVKEYQVAGEYALEIPTYQLPAGIYFYRLVSGDYMETRKMVVRP